jgi:hypothetical protein
LRRSNPSRGVRGVDGFAQPTAWSLPSGAHSREPWLCPPCECLLQLSNSQTTDLKPSLRAIGSRQARPDDSEAIQLWRCQKESWIASSQVLLAKTLHQSQTRIHAPRRGRARAFAGTSSPRKAEGVANAGGRCARSPAWPDMRRPSPEATCVARLAVRYLAVRTGAAGGFVGGFCAGLKRGCCSTSVTMNRRVLSHRRVSPPRSSPDHHRSPRHGWSTDRHGGDPA